MLRRSKGLQGVRWVPVAMALLVGCGGSDGDAEPGGGGDSGEAGSPSGGKAGKGGTSAAGTAGSGGQAAGAGGSPSGGQAGQGGQVVAGSGGSGQSGTAGAAGSQAGSGQAGSTAAGSSGTAGGGQAGGGAAGSGQAGGGAAGSGQAGSGQAGSATGGQPGGGQAGSAVGGQPGGGQGGGGQAGQGTGCCQSNQDCAGQGQGPQECVQGECLPVQSSGICWQDSDCGDLFYCEGEQVCPCGAQCGPQASNPGKCVLLGPNCCKTDDECVKAGLSQCVDNVCKDTVKPGQCWDIGDCGPNQVCEGATVCPCGAMCKVPDSPGVCIDVGLACCQTDDECLKADPNFPRCEGGTCQKQPVAGSCWDAQDCGGQPCNNVILCPCGSACPLADQPGTCGTAGACCQTDTECQQQGLAQCVNSVCVGKVEVGTCWDSGDCAPGQSCQGEFVCPCGAKCDQPDTVGKCSSPNDVCCKGDFDCQLQGLDQCVNNACVSKTPFGCWDDGDCALGQSCQGEFVCPCGAVCEQPTTPGKCTTTSDICCKTDSECVQQGLAQCVSNVCVGKLPPNGCWDSGDCAPGQSCQGEFVCPCGAKCDQPDTVGKCTTSSDVCCKGDFDCQLQGLNQCVNNTCVSQAPVGGCWDDGDCKFNQTCEGEFVCPCGAQCLQPDTAGKCVDPSTTTCCAVDKDCGLGAECVMGSFLDKGVCKKLPDPGTCWDSGDCKPNQKCVGQQVCACGQNCILPDTVGKCQ